jgi:hypothetical protein
MNGHSFYKAHHDEYLRRHRAAPRNPRIRQDRAERRTH